MALVLEKVSKRIKDMKEALLKAFADSLFDKADDDFLQAFDADSLVAMARSGFNLLKHRPSEVHVRVFNPSYQTDGWEAPYTVAEVCLRDRPFIVDSLRAALKRQSYEVYYLLHPILPLTYEGNELVDIGKEGATFAYEMYFIDQIEEEGKRAALEAKLKDVLHDVVLATDSYEAIRKKTRELHDYLLCLKENSLQEKWQLRVEELAEYAQFMAWLDEDNFVFLGYREYDIVDIESINHLQITEGSGLGILSKLSSSAYKKPVAIREIPEGLRERVTGGRILIVTKTNAESSVHRPVRMDYIGVKKLSDSWDVLGERRFIGLFTSKALTSPVETIPILRLKLRRVLELDRALPGSHDYKQIHSIFNSMPREELFWADAEQLHAEVRTIMGLEQERGVRLAIRPDPLGRGLAAMVLMPRERFNAEVRRAIQAHLYDKLEAVHFDYQLAMGEEESQLRFHFFFTTDLRHFDVDIPALERDIAELTRTWDDHMLERLLSSKGDAKGRRLAENYLAAFEPAYKTNTTIQAALRDIEQLEILGDSRYQVDMLNVLDEEIKADTTLIKIYHQDHSLILSEVMPILENLGFCVIEEQSYSFTLPERLRGVDIFKVKDLERQKIDVGRHGARLIEALSLLLNEKAENDHLNQLVLYAELTVRQVALLRAYQMYYAQLNAVTSRQFINDTLLRHPRISALLYAAFAAKFNPHFDRDRQTEFEKIKVEFLDALQVVDSLAEDTLLRGLLNLVESTLRSNFFLGKELISFKLASQQIESMPEPRPLYEIAVSSLGVAGTHLRGGKVARGGIRWSDRPDDFRTEILGLMKTQMTKNAVIVPVGSKGGFVVKNAPSDPKRLRLYVQEQYQAFIRGLLDVTDNLIEDRVVHPAELIIYDEEDPYLVVAADKGTASFSDLANDTAAEYDFWLGDAFASGGSYGYDHKKEGITARGAWECVSRHFREMGIDVQKDQFTVVAIGDMSGDVFGNGMLYSDKIKLQAAFNHLHIFIDPDPDSSASFKERKRLFELPRSSWADYDKARISQGGGIFERGAKAIVLSPEIKELLGVERNEVTGQELIRLLLKMPAQLLWNGGIGTYVKAASESHHDVGDSSNDAVRIDADELQVKVVGEGGNLGFTQLARVSFALQGGRINTDAIDNSAGVDMSDHEVNIKIMLQSMLKAGELSFVQRNRLLEAMTDEVSQLVLKDNYFQSLALTLAERRVQKDPALFLSLADYLAENGRLDPRVEFLAGRKVLQERQKNGKSFTRPELAILLAYTKMGIFRRLLETTLPDEPYFEHYLFEYFPKRLRKKYKKAIQSHPLRREIAATQFTNTIVDLLGLSFVHRVLRDTGALAVEVIQAGLITLELLDVKQFLGKLTALDNGIPTDVQYSALECMVNAVEGMVTWVLLSDQTIDSIEAFVSRYHDSLIQLRQDIGSFLPEAERKRYKASHKRWLKKGFSEEFANDLASLDYLPSSMGVVEISKEMKLMVKPVAKSFYKIGERLSLGWLRDQLVELPMPSKWDKIAVSSLTMELRQTQQRLSKRFLSHLDQKMTLETFFTSQERLIQRYDEALADIRHNESLSLASAAVLSRMLLKFDSLYKVK